MLNRQKIVLALLDSAERALSRTEFVKLMFLLRQETPLGKEMPFYDFVPYKFGPFSFSLYRELEALSRDGYIVEGPDHIALSVNMRDQIGSMLGKLPRIVLETVSGVIHRYGRMSQDALMKETYKRYPWYATKSELTDLQPTELPIPQNVRPAVYTAGYQEKTVDAFFDGLLNAGIRMVIDVRANPVSRKYGFARRSMSGIADKLGLEYRHLPKLGIPSEQRAELSNFASYQRLLDAYEQRILSGQRQDISNLGQLTMQRPSALVCMEKDVRCCHRSRLADAVSQANGLPVVHLS